MGTSVEGSGDGLQRSDNDSAARTRHPDTVALDAVVKVAAAAVLLEEGVEGAEERHAHKSSRSYCFRRPGDDREPLAGQYALLDHLVRPRQHRLRDRQAEGLILLRTFS